MQRILHRINTKKELLNTPCEFGVEVDIRSNGGQLYMHHDPFLIGENFEDWLELYNHATLILNVKEEGLESRLMALMKKYGIDDYFFLDQSFPFLVKTANNNEKRCAIRVSEYENIETAMSLAKKISWVWVDCFTHFPLTANDVKRLQVDGSFQLCFVSPELQGYTDEQYVIEFRSKIESMGIKGDAVCTKYPHLWA